MPGKSGTPMHFLFMAVKLTFYGLATLFAPIALQLLLLYYLSFALARLMARVLGFSLSVYVTAPGTIIHELSHFMACIFTGTPVADMKLFSPTEDPPGSGRWVLGEVTRGTGSYLGNLIISIAPFFGCTAALIFALQILIPGNVIPPFPYRDLSHLTLFTLGDAVSFLFIYCGTYISYLVDFILSLNPLDLRTYLFVLLTFTIAPGIAPSPSDFKHFWSALGVCILFLIPLAFIFHLFGVPFISLTQKQWGNTLIEISSYLGMATIICLGGVLLFLLIDFLKALAKEE
jgi:hypothetical protein